MKRVLICIILLALCFLSVMTSETHADGKYFPAKAYRTSPTIHSQRAILKYKDGVETLVIESSFDGEGKDFGWVIPLPSKPTNFEQASPGFLETLSDTIQPKIIHDSGVLQIFICLTIIIGLDFVLKLFYERKKFSILFTLIVVVLVIVAFMPPLGMKGEMSGGVNVLDVQDVGSFGLVVLDADNPEVLNDWLTDNGFVGLNESERKIASDYIKEGWCFVAAKLKRDGERYTEPHPLAMTFEIEKPIYPMRLTAAANSDVELELFVIADSYASSPGLIVEHASRYLYDAKARIGLSGYIGSYRSSIGHPDKDKFMWDKCVITRLYDVLSPEDMKEDILVELNKGNDFQKNYYSQKGAFESGLAYGLAGWCCTMIVLSILAKRKTEKSMSRADKILKILLPATIFLFLLWGVVHKSADVVKVSLDKNGGWIAKFLHEAHVSGSLSTNDEEGVFLDCKNIADVETKLKKDVFSEIKGIKLEDSPGNVTVIEDDRGLVIRLFKRGGFYEDILLSDRGE